MQIIIEDLAIAYDVTGQGEPIVLLHGWGDNRDTFTELTDHLKGNYQVVSVDLPGFGQSQPPHRAWGLQDYSQFVAQFLDKLAITPYALLGHSNGGAIAIRAVGDTYISCQKLILLASSGVRKKTTVRKMLFTVIARGGKLLSSFLPEASRNKLKNRLYTAAGSDYLVTPHMSETFKKIVKEDVRDAANKIAAPTLLLYGEHDSETPPAHGQALSELIPDSKFEVIKGAGHHLHHDAADNVINRITQFLQT